MQPFVPSKIGKRKKEKNDEVRVYVSGLCVWYIRQVNDLKIASDHLKFQRGKEQFEWFSSSKRIQTFYPIQWDCHRLTLFKIIRKLFSPYRREIWWIVFVLHVFIFIGKLTSKSLVMIYDTIDTTTPSVTDVLEKKATQFLYSNSSAYRSAYLILSILFYINHFSISHMDNWTKSLCFSISFFPVAQRRKLTHSFVLFSFPLRSIHPSFLITRIASSGWFDAEYIKQRTIFAVKQYAIDTFATHIDLSFIGTIGLWQWTITAIGFRNGKTTCYFCFRNNNSCTPSIQWQFNCLH